MPARHARRFRGWLPLLAGMVVLAAGTVVVQATRGDEAGPGGDARGQQASSASPAAGSPTPSPTPSPSPSAEPKGKLVIHATGDVSLDPSYIPALRANGYGWAWSGLDGLFERDDLTIINHECPSTDLVAPISKTFVFRCDPAALAAAFQAGVEVANLANNHGYDHGPDALLDSIHNMKAAGLIPVGAGPNAERADAPRYVSVRGWKIAIIGVGEVLDPLNQVATDDRAGTAVGHDFDRALRAIREAEANADLVLVTIHWGVELDTQPREYQIQEARRMIRAGADAIFGHHSHRLQPMDTFEGRPIFYGLGNFVWPRFSAEGATTAVARIVVRPNGTVEGTLLPAEIVSDGHPVLR